MHAWGTKRARTCICEAWNEKKCLFASVRVMDDYSLHDEVLLIESMQSDLSFK